MKKLLGIVVLGFLWCSASITAETLGEQLIKLESLYKRGTITKEEFTKAKTILLKIDTQSSEKIEKAKEKIKKQKEKEKKDKLITKLKSEVSQKKTYNSTEITKWRTNAPDQWERTQFYFDDYRVYAHRPGAIKIQRISDGKQIAVLTKNFTIKYYNDGEGLFEIKKFKQNTLEKNTKLEELIPLLGTLNKEKKKLEKRLSKALGQKELPGKMIVKYNGATFLSWERIFVPRHNAQFYQLLALDEQPFHFYVVHSKGEFALNMSKFTRKIDIAIAEVKKKLQKEYNLTPEEMEAILKQRKQNLDRQLAAISKETEKAIARETNEAITQETDKAVESEVNKAVASAVDDELAEELEAAIGASVAKEFVSAIEEASGQAIDDALTAELAIEVDRAIKEAISEGVSAAAAEAGIRAGLAVLAAGGTEQEATDACSAAAGTQC